MALAEQVGVLEVARIFKAETQHPIETNVGDPDESDRQNLGLPDLWGDYRRYFARDRFEVPVLAPFSEDMPARVRWAGDHVANVRRPPDGPNPAIPLARILSRARAARDSQTA